MSSSERPLRVRADGLEWRVLEDETVVLDLRGSRYLAINRAGTVLWQLLVKGATRSQLIGRLTEDWAIGEGDAARDVDAFCARLRAEGLLSR
jgi:hypothetical protein